jgi:hypothetical protein
MSSMSILIAGIAALWLLSCGASALALYLGGRAQRYRAAVVSSCVALLTAYGGLTRARFSASETVNGRVQWSVDSRWFFIAALALAAAALALSLWKWRQAAERAGAPSRTLPSGQ